MIKFLQGIALILFAALCILGIQKYSSITNDVEKEPEDPVTEEVEDTEPEVKVLDLKIYLSSTTESSYTVQYEEGMTWNDWIASSYNTYNAKTVSGRITFDISGSSKLLMLGTNYPSGSDVIDSTARYCFG